MWSAGTHAELHDLFNQRDFKGVVKRLAAEFVGTGVNKGPMGPFPATSRPASFRLCEILTYDADELITGGEIYYDQMGLLAQLGHIEPPTG